MNLGDFSTTQFSLAENEHLAYNLSTQAFFSVNKKDKLDTTCTKDLGKMTQIVNAWFLEAQQQPLTENLPTIKANVDAFNQICDHRLAVHNSRIENHFLLRLIEKIVSFVTRGNRGLKIREEVCSVEPKDEKKAPFQCDRKQLLDYRLKDLIFSKFSVFLRDEQTDELKVLATTVKPLLTSEEFKELVFDPFSDFNQLSYNKKQVFGELFQIHHSPLDWKNFEEKRKVNILAHVVNETKSDRSSPMEEFVYGECLNQYENLSLEKKIQLQNLLESPFLPKSREGRLLLLQFLSENLSLLPIAGGFYSSYRLNGKQSNDKYRDLFNEILGSEN